MLILILGTPAISADFRNTEWGMSREQVQKTESGELLEDSNNRSLKLYNLIVETCRQLEEVNSKCSAANKTTAFYKRLKSTNVKHLILQLQRLKEVLEKRKQESERFSPN